MQVNGKNPKLQTNTRYRKNYKKENKKIKARSLGKDTVLDRCTIQHDTLITWLQTCNGNKKKENSCFIGKPTEATLVRNFSAALSAPRREISNNKEGVEKQGWDNALRKARYFNPASHGEWIFLFKHL